MKRMFFSLWAIEILLEAGGELRISLCGLPSVKRRTGVAEIDKLFLKYFRRAKPLQTGSLAEARRRHD